MTTDEFAYDVAFSFLSQDESLALALSDDLSDRYKAFVFPKAQEVLAGTDGQESFGEIFGKTARTVVVLYRNGWGNTRWTRTEETAIKNRALESGWDFLLFIKLDAAATMPKYLHRSYIWHDYERYGRTGAAGAIGALVQRVGGAPRVESIEQHAARVQRDLEYHERRQRFLTSELGVTSAREAVDEIINLAEARCFTFAPLFGFRPVRGRVPRELAIHATGPAGMIRWIGRYSNTLQGAYLEVSFWMGHPPLWGNQYFPGGGPEELESWRFDFDIDRSDSPIWSRNSSNFSNQGLVDELFKGLLTWAQKRAAKPR